MIPKIIHYCWFGGKEKPALVKKCLASWRKYCPGWEIREWRLENRKDPPQEPPHEYVRLLRSGFSDSLVLKSRFLVDAVEAKKWAFASDLARFAIIAAEGGVYFDTDVELITPIDDLVSGGAFFACEQDDPRVINPGLGFAAEAGNPVLKAIIAKYETMTFDPACHMAQTSPVVVTEVLRNFPEMRCLPSRVFNPKGGCAGEVRLSPDTRAIHHYDASWFSWKQRLAYIWWPRVKKAFVQACWPTLVFFGALFLSDAIDAFGYDGVTGSYWYPVWNLTRNTVTYTLIVTSLVYFLGRAARWVLVPMFAWALVCTTVCIRTMHVYHVPLWEVWLQALGDASREEIVQTLRLNLTPGVLAGAVAVVALIVLYAILMHRRPPLVLPRRTRFAVGFALALPFLVLNALGMYRFKGFAQMHASSFLICTYINWRDHRGAQRAFANGGLPERVRSAVPLTELPDLMIVVGESSTRTHWHLYGYARDTTPRMDARAAKGEITVLRGVTCARPNTGPSLEHLLTDCEAEHPEKGSWTLPELLRRTGYRTRLVSNQPDLPRQDCYQVFNGCERRTYLHEILPPDTANYDELVLPHVAAAFDGTNGAPIAVFVHLAGMHFPVEECYPTSAAHFPGTDRIDRYDNATRYQDLILDALLKIVAQRKKWLFLYVSDHGETPSSNVWRDFRDPDVYAVPAIIAPAHPGIPDGLRQDELTELILTLSGVHEKGASR